MCVDWTCINVNRKDACSFYLMETVCIKNKGV